jgi:hypothetical protein
MITERTDKEILIRIPNNVNIEGVQRLIDYIKYQEVTPASHASQKDADSLAEEAMASWYNKFRANPCEINSNCSASLKNL